MLIGIRGGYYFDSNQEGSNENSSSFQRYRQLGLNPKNKYCQFG